MKFNLLTKTLLLFLCIILWGCPYESPYAIDTEAQITIDESLLGKWAAFVPRPSDDRHYREEPVKIIFEKRTEMEYDVAITGYIDELRRSRIVTNDTIKGTAFLSVIDNRQFLNTFIHGKVYIAEVKQKDNTLDILTLSEHFTAKFIKNSEALRTAISVHYKTRSAPVYDDWFLAKNMQRVN
jgi:hypothetical protein